MTAMRDIFTVAAKIKKLFAYKFTPLDSKTGIHPAW